MPLSAAPGQQQKPEGSLGSAGLGTVWLCTTRHSIGMAQPSFFAAGTTCWLVLSRAEPCCAVPSCTEPCEPSQCLGLFLSGPGLCTSPRSAQEVPSAHLSSPSGWQHRPLMDQQPLLPGLLSAVVSHHPDRPCGGLTALTPGLQGTLRASGLQLDHAVLFAPSLQVSEHISELPLSLLQAALSLSPCSWPFTALSSKQLHVPPVL